MPSIIKIAGFDWTSTSGPLCVTGVQLSGSMPGGHGSASFEVPVGNAYLAPHHTLKEGAWISIYDDAHELYEGEIFSVKPVIDIGGQHKLSVVCGGLISVAGKRADVSATWVHRGSEGWRLLPVASEDQFGIARVDAGAIELRVKAGTSYLSPTVWLDACYVLDDGLSDDAISYVSGIVDWNVATDSGNTWSWWLYGSATLGSAFDAAALITHSNDSGAASAFTATPVAGTKVLTARLRCTGMIAVSTVPQFVTFTEMNIFGRARTTKPRIDEAMVDLATRTGLATSSLSEPVGAMLDDLRIGNGLAKVTAAGGMSTVAGLYAQPFEWGFWDERAFICKPQPLVPANDSKVIVVGGGNPGLDSWDVAEYDEDVPDYACVHFGNKDDATLPEGWPRRLYRPSTPADDADLRVEIVDFSSLILSDAAAAAAGDNIVGTDAGDTPTGYVLDAEPARADSGKWPGNNADPTAAYRELVQVIDGTLSGFAYTAVSGWSGSNSPADPCCLAGDGTNDYVSFGDVAACDFGTGPFTAREWLKFDALPSGAAVAFGKLDGDRGWSLGITNAGHLRGYVGGSGAVAPGFSATGGTKTTDGSYTVHKFTATGGSTLSCAEGTSIDAEYMVAGAGGGGSTGGGGAGGYLTGTVTLSGSVPITVGQGGPGHIYTTSGDDGGQSALGAITAAGGGGGARGAGYNGRSGGSGGGGGWINGAGTTTGGSATPAGQGNAGGGNAATAAKAGGGGGAAAAGGEPHPTGHNGDGGAGYDNDIVLTGTNVGYCGGGGGAGYSAGNPGGATHGGAAGSDAVAQTPAATANCGGGGGAHSAITYSGGDGGSGIVVVRYLTPAAAANCRQQTGDTVMAVGVWYCCEMSYAGSGADIALHINGHAETLTAGGAVGAHDLSNAGNLQMFKGSAAPYMDGSLGRSTVWLRALTTDEALTDYGVGQGSYNRSRAKGTVVITGTVKNRLGTPVPAKHVRAGWWIQNLDRQTDPAKAPDTLYITGHSVDLAAGKNALTIGIDWMEKEIGVRQAELLAIPATDQTVPDAESMPGVTPYEPTDSTTTTPPSLGGQTQFRGGGTVVSGMQAPAGYQWVDAGEASISNPDGSWGAWLDQGLVLRAIGQPWSR